MQSDIVVYLRAGVYALGSALTMDQRDSGRNGFRVLWTGYPGEQVILSGGTTIRGWTPDAAGRWSAPTTLDNFRQLYVNGKRATRGRSGPLTSPALFGDLAHVNGVAGFTSSDPQMAGWGNPQDLEFGFFATWTHMVCGVQSASSTGGQSAFVMRQPCFYLARNKVGTQAGFPAYVENALELTTSPGQFYLDRVQHRVFYVPRPGEDMRSAEVVAPALATLLSVTGTVDSPATGIVFTNLTFQHASWLVPSQFGFPEVQANFFMSHDLTRMYTDVSGNQRDINNEFEKTPGAVVLTYAQNVTFERCVFQHLGGSGLDLQLGSQNDSVSGAVFTDISANGIQIGDVQRNDHHPGDTRMLVKGNSLTNSYLHDVGVEFDGSVAVFLGYTDSTRIAHNEVTRVPYTGISAGWGWGMQDAGAMDVTTSMPFTTRTPSGNNRIEFNHIHGVQTRSSDGGGVYTLGASPGTLVANNLIHDNVQPPGGLYLDEASTGITVTSNVVYGEQLWYGNVLAPLYANITAAQLAQNVIQANLFDDPAQAATLSGKAGLEAPYQDLLK